MQQQYQGGPKSHVLNTCDIQFEKDCIKLIERDNNNNGKVYLQFYNSQQSSFAKDYKFTCLNIEVIDNKNHYICEKLDGNILGLLTNPNTGSLTSCDIKIIFPQFCEFVYICHRNFTPVRCAEVDNIYYYYDQKEKTRKIILIEFGFQPYPQLVDYDTQIDLKIIKKLAECLQQSIKKIIYDLNMINSYSQLFQLLYEMQNEQKYLQYQQFYQNEFPNIIKPSLEQKIQELKLKFRMYNHNMEDLESTQTLQNTHHLFLLNFLEKVIENLMSNHFNKPYLHLYFRFSILVLEQYKKNISDLNHLQLSRKNHFIFEYNEIWIQQLCQNQSFLIFSIDERIKKFKKRQSDLTVNDEFKSFNFLGDFNQNEKQFFNLTFGTFLKQEKNCGNLLKFYLILSSNITNCFRASLITKIYGNTYGERIFTIIETIENQNEDQLKLTIQGLEKFFFRKK